MTQDILMLEVGSGPIADLTTAELNLILAAYTDDQKLPAAMKVFDLLRKKFKSSYKMGSTFEALSDKYRQYNALYNQYASTASAGRSGTPATIETPEQANARNDIERQKWVRQTRP